MVKESGRKCSHCGNNGHNSRTCNGKGCLKLFGVRIVMDKGVDESMRKSLSMGNLESLNHEHHSTDSGYLSDGLLQSKRGKDAHERKKGIPWSEKEHRSFLIGLKKLGKGDWRGISKNYVHTRTPTQVASHAQKYFLRQAATDRKRRSSLFDMSFKEPVNSSRNLQVSPVSSSDNTAEIPIKTCSSPILPLKKTIEIPSQASIQPQDAKALLPHCTENPSILPMAPTYGFGQVPYMMAGSDQGFPLVPVMDLHMPGGYIYLAKSHGNFATCAPFTSHLSSMRAPKSLPHGLSQPDPAASLADLELKIAPPQESKVAELSSSTPGAISVI